jgi:hypothetical protein
MDKNTEATVDSTQLDDSTATDSRTEEQMLADIIANSEFTESLPNEQDVPELDTEEPVEEDPETEDAETEEVEEEVETEEEEATDEDDASTQEAEVYTPDDLDLDAKVAIKIDGEETEVSFSDLIKGYSTEQHLSNEGRKLGDARKKLDEEYQAKFKEINDLGQASSAILYREEQALAKKYHDIEAQIDQARKDGDTYEVNELKDKREQAQKNYWNARNNREQLVKQVQAQVQEQTTKQWNEQLEHFNKTIPEMIPDFNEKTATAIREFAIAEGIQPEMLDRITDPIIVKFVDDYRRLKQGVTKGSAKRKATVVKKAPVRKAKTKSQKEVDYETKIRQRAFAEDSSNEDQMAFLRGLAEKSLNY